MIRIFCLLGLFVISHTFSVASAAERQSAGSPVADAIRTDTPSGLPVPRFVSLKSKKTNCRGGPSFDHPVRIVFVRAGLPLKVVAETMDHWRKVSDADGDRCWIHRSKLSGAPTVLVLDDGVALRRAPFASAKTRAHLGRGLIAKVHKSRDGWLQVSTGRAKGWAPQSAFWGGPQMAAESDEAAGAD